MKRLDQWTSALLILVGLVSIFWILPRETVPGEPGELAPADLPKFALWAIVLCAAAQLLASLRRSSGDTANPMDRFAVLFLVGSAALLFAALVGIFQLGYVFGGILCLLAIALLMRPSRSMWPWIIGVCLVLPTGLYWLTWHVLRLSLP
jgi:hypothetical protein